MSAVIRQTDHLLQTPSAKCFWRPYRRSVPPESTRLASRSDQLSWPRCRCILSSGWPVNYRLSSNPEPFDSNNSSAVNFAQTVDSFIETELSHEATAGPFKDDPFPSGLPTLLLKTVDKDKTKRRVVLDLRFPPGRSVNDGIPKDTFLDVSFHLTLPRSADFVNLILSKGPGSFLYKKDSKRVYRQMEGQLLFWSCFTIRVEVCYHGLQRTTTAIAYMFKSEFNFACINYVDDFGGVEKDHTTASTALHQLANLFQRLGLESPPSKDWVPSTRMLFLGLVYDTLKMSIEVPQDKLDNITRLVRNASTPALRRVQN